MTSTLQDRLRDMLPGLPAELQRAARWALDNPAEVGLWSMRRQAQAVGVAPATMLRMARAAGCDTYEAFRAPFQRALTKAWKRAGATAPRACRPGAPKRPLWTRAPPHPLADRRTGIHRRRQRRLRLRRSRRHAAGRPPGRLPGHALGLRHRLPDALCLPDAVPQRHADRRPGRRLLRRGRYLGQGDALVVVTQAPYAAATLELARSAAERGAAVIALTDAPPARSFRSPAMSCASRGRGCARRHGRTRFVLPQHGGPARPGRAPDRARRRPGRRRRIATAVRNRIAPARRWRVLARNAWPPSPSRARR